jgi:hypothetical protein
LNHDGMSHLDFTRVVVGAVACVLARGALPAAAQPAQPPLVRPDDARPWAVGVSEREQAIATEFYAAGNREFTESHFASALAAYKEAIRHWDHPAIRFNIAVCLINLDQPVEARDNLERSLVHGPTPLGADVHAQGLTYRKLLDAQLSRVRIGSREPSVQVTLDGKLLFNAPGWVDLFLLPGEHQVTATKPGYLTATKTLVLVAGKATVYEVPRLEIRPTSRIVRRWAAWRPWALATFGAATIGAGTANYLAARSNFASYDWRVATRCRGGCDAQKLAAFTSIRAKLDTANSQQEFAFILFSVGGAAAIAGALGIMLNQPRVQLVTGAAAASIAPIPGGATASIAWRY